MKTVVVGMDISKSTIDATIVFLGKEDSLHDSFLNKPFGHSELLTWACKHGDKNSLFFCLEHTGHYGWGISRMLDKKRIRLFTSKSLVDKTEYGFTSGKIG